MHDDLDPVEGALRSLAKVSWAHRVHEAQLEEKLMLGFEKPTIGSRMLRHKLLVGALAVVLAGGAGFAATGGAEAVRQFMIQVKMIGPDGVIVDGTLQPVEGDANRFELQTPDGGNATVILDKANPEQLQVHVTKTLDGDGAVAGGDGPVQITMTTRPIGEGDDAAINAILEQHMAEVAAKGEHAGKVLIAAPHATIARVPAVVEAIEEPVEVFQWAEQDGTLKEVSIVPLRGDLGGYRVYSTLEDGRYAQIGMVVLTNAAETAVADMVLDEDGRATIAFVGGDGKEISVPIRPVTRLDQLHTAGSTPRQIILQKSDQARE